MKFDVLKKKVFAHYGNKCICCGDSHWEFLTMDHVDGGGHKHRKEVVGSHLYAWLKRNNFPPGFQLMCMNCNFAKGIFGKCPHVSEAVEVAIAGS